jgi:hypothetical protein
LPIMVGIVGMIALAAVLLSGKRAPFWEYEVVGISQDGDLSRYAVTYRVNHPVSANPLHFTLIGRRPQSVGSFGLEQGQSALSWRGVRDARPVWTDGKLMLAVPVGTVRQRGSFVLCTQDQSAQPMVCFDPAIVSITTASP